MSVTIAPLEAATARPPAVREVVFDVRDLGVRYRGAQAIRGVTLEVYRNLVTAVIGPSGSGKSTFIRWFLYGFANAVGEEEAKELYETFAVPASGLPIFQAATANLNPWTEAKVDTKNPERGPLLIVSGEKDHTVPRAIAHASYKRQLRNEGVTEFVEIPGRGHALTIDGGWREVAATALAFVGRFVPAEAA